MVFTEIQKRKGKKYYYRVKSSRSGKKIKKDRMYLGTDLDKKTLSKAEEKADKQLDALKNIITEEEIYFLEKIKKEYANQPKENFESRYEAFCARFTYNSNAIEGNTLTLQQTAQLLFENIVPADKSLREINEALNHKSALDYILSYSGDINKKLMLYLHELVVKNTLKQELVNQVGKYRNVQVFIRGAEWLPPKPKEIPQEMKSLLASYTKNKNKLHPLVQAAYFHIGFETIHPFIDGNGRVGRLLMNCILKKNNYPMINIPHTKKSDYYKTLEEAQVRGNIRPFIELLLQIYKEEKLFI